MRSHRPILFLFAAVMFSSSIASANTAPAATREEVRKELSTFFAHVGDSPTPLGAISKSPQILDAINKRIEAMSDAEITEFQKMMTQVPDWQNAPQAVTKMLPPGALKKIENTTAEMKAQAPQAEQTRSNIGTLAAVLRMLPDEKLKELGIERSMVGSLQLMVNQMSPMQAGVLEQQLAGNKAWQANSAAAMASLPPALQRGAAALAKHGPMTKDDLEQLDKFRAEVTSLLTRVDALPEETKKQLKIENLRAQIAQLDLITPDVVFMLREQMTPESLQSLADSVKLMEHISKISDDDRKTLEHFRGELNEIFAKGDHAAENREKIASLTPSELLILKDGMPDFSSWKERTSAYLAAVNDPGLSQRIAALNQPTPDPALIASLEQFRGQTLTYIDSVAVSVNPALAASARKAVENAPLPKLELLRTVTANSRSISPEGLLRVATDISLDCKVGLGSIDVAGVSISLGTIDFNFICKPIQDAINGIAGQISAAVDAAKNALNNTINTVKNGLQSAINVVANTVNDIVNGLVSTVSSIWNFIQTIPDLAWKAIQFAWNALLDVPIGNGLTIRKLIAGGISVVVPALQNVLNIGEGFWNSLNGILPLLPCPNDGTSTPFGTVGDSLALTKYNRYKFFIDKIINLIPSDAVSLEVKVPATILYAAYDYLGVCMADAAAARDSALADTRYGNLSTGINNLLNQGSTNTTLLMVQLTNSFNALTNLSNNNTSSLTTLITNKTIDLQTLIKQKSEDARLLNLRLQIELNLQAGQGQALAAFELPQANGGYLEMARDIVNNAINSMLAAGQSIGHAQSLFSDGLAEMSAGHFKSAYASFQKAYRDLTANH